MEPVKVAVDLMDKGACEQAQLIYQNWVANGGDSSVDTAFVLGWLTGRERLVDSLFAVKAIRGKFTRQALNLDTHEVNTVVTWNSA